ncbi:MAG: hypothetical protein ACKVRP_02435 [Bacteroidota bacterium]
MNPLITGIVNSLGFLCLLAIAIVLVIFLFGCSDLGTEPVIQSPEWIEVHNFHYARSAWFDFISVQFDIPSPSQGEGQGGVDSLLVVNHTDSDARYITALSLDPGVTGIHHRFFFPDGYVDRLPFELSLSVFIKLNPTIQ